MPIARSQTDRAYSLGGAVAVTTRPPTTATPEPPIRITEIDEALAWSALTYWPRDRMWHRWINHLLDQRLRLAAHAPTNTEPQ